MPGESSQNLLSDFIKCFAFFVPFVSVTMLFLSLFIAISNCSSKVDRDEISAIEECLELFDLVFITVAVVLLSTETALSMTLEHRKTKGKATRRKIMWNNQLKV